MAYKPSDRLSAAAALKHPWLASAVQGEPAAGGSAQLLLRAPSAVADSIGARPAWWTGPPPPPPGRAPGVWVLQRRQRRRARPITCPSRPPLPLAPAAATDTPPPAPLAPPSPRAGSTVGTTLTRTAETLGSAGGSLMESIEEVLPAGLVEEALTASNKGALTEVRALRRAARAVGLRDGGAAPFAAPRAQHPPTHRGVLRPRCKCAAPCGLCAQVSAGAPGFLHPHPAPASPAPLPRPQAFLLQEFGDPADRAAPAPSRDSRQTIAWWQGRQQQMQKKIDGRKGGATPSGSGTSTPGGATPGNGKAAANGAANGKAKAAADGNGKAKARAGGAGGSGEIKVQAPAPPPGWENGAGAGGAADGGSRVPAVGGAKSAVRDLLNVFGGKR